MGIYITAEQVYAWAGQLATSSTKGAKPQSMYVPLIMMLKDQEYFKFLTDKVSLPKGHAATALVAQGEYKPQPGEVIISMADTEKKEWYKFMSHAGVYPPDVIKRHIDAARARGEEIDPALLEKAQNFTDDTEKSEHIRQIQKALGVAPLVDPEAKKKEK